MKDNLMTLVEKLKTEIASMSDNPDHIELNDLLSLARKLSKAINKGLEKDSEFIIRERAINANY
jgi:hypothetical protein